MPIVPVAPVPTVDFVVLGVRVVTLPISFEQPISIPDNHCDEALAYGSVAGE